MKIPIPTSFSTLAPHLTKTKEWQTLIAAFVGSVAAILAAWLALNGIRDTITSQTKLAREQAQAQAVLANEIETRHINDELNHIRVALCAELRAIRQDAHAIDEYAFASYADQKTTAAIVVYKPRAQIYQSVISKIYLLSPEEIFEVYRAYEFQGDLARSARQVFASADGETFTLNRNHMQFAQIKFMPLTKFAEKAILTLQKNIPKENAEQCTLSDN